MTQSKQKKQKTILPEDSRSAVNIMTAITKQLLELLIEEAKLLKAGDLLTLNAMQKGKAILADGYTKASVEFKGRMNEFKDIDTMEIDKLEIMTQELGKAAKDNQKRIEALSTKKSVSGAAQNNLFLLQQNEEAQQSAAQQ